MLKIAVYLLWSQYGKLLPTIPSLHFEQAFPSSSSTFALHTSQKVPENCVLHVQRPYLLHILGATPFELHPTHPFLKENIVKEDLESMYGS